MTPLFGQTRSVFRNNYALLEPAGLVASNVPGWRNVVLQIVISPAMGAHFTQTHVTFATGGCGEGRASANELAGYVLSGELELDSQGREYTLRAGGFFFVPAATGWTLRGESGTQIVFFKKRFVPLSGDSAPKVITGQAAEVEGQPFLGDPAARLQVLLPDVPAFDLAMNIFTYQPGATLPMVETHIMEHGLVMLSGQGVYRLHDDWHPVRAGDVIWMGPYCPQWFVAMGKEPASYLYYKDVNLVPAVNLEIDRELLNRSIDELALISEVAPPVVTRVLFSEADLRARIWVRKRCTAAGLAVREDAVGNLFARWAGSEPDLPAVATGSHCDAIPNAGRFDGVVGVLGGLEAFCALRRGGFRPRRSLEVIMFTAEEPTRFGIGCLGSRLLAGACTAAQARALRDPEGRSLEELRTAAGCRGELESVALPPGHFHAFVELHIEQGPLLERAGLPIGLVEAIAGPSSFRLVLHGEGGHAGAVLMPDRHDASLAGAEIALAVERAARASGSVDTVGTTGVFRIEPGAINSVPFRATLELDVRDTRLASRERAVAEIRRTAEEVCARRGVRLEFSEINADPPAAGDQATIAIAEAVCTELGLPFQRMISRAYHDALFMARICPTTMIFIPCRNGWSHRPEEFAEPEHIATGTMVLAHTLARLAA